MLPWISKFDYTVCILFFHHKLDFVSQIFIITQELRFLEIRTCIKNLILTLKVFYIFKNFDRHKISKFSLNVRNVKYPKEFFKRKGCLSSYHYNRKKRLVQVPVLLLLGAMVFYVCIKTNFNGVFSLLE